MAKVIKIEIPVELVNNSEPALSTIIKGLTTMDSAAKTAQKSMRSMTQSSGASRFERSYQKVMGSMRSMMTAGKQRYQSVMELKDRVSPVVKKITSGIKSVAGKTWNITMKAGALATAPIRNVAGALTSPLMAAGVSLSAGAMAGDAISTYAGFTSQMSQVQAISGATKEEFAQLTEKAKEMGATTKFTAQESAEAFTYMGMAGWKSSDMLNGIEGILNLAAASGENLGTTSDIVTDALTAFNLKASDATHFSDVLAAATSNANTTVSGMGDTFKYVGSMAGALGYSVEDVALATGLMANAGIKGTMSGTALNAIMTRLSTNTSGATDTLKSLGVEFFNADGTARSLSTVMGELRTATADMTDEQKSNLANTVAGMEAQKGLLAILNASEEDYNKLSEAIANADGASQRMADTMMDNLSGKFTLLRSAVDGVKIAFGTKVQPYLMDGLDWLLAKMPAVQDALMRGVDRIEDFAGSIKEKIAGFTSTSEWENAGLFGKIHIAWDELIGQPLSEWWNGDGQAKIENMVHDIGTGLGTALSTGILTLMGMDVSSTIEDAKGIGQQFAQGFSEGFQGVRLDDILWKGLGKGLSGAGSMLGMLPGMVAEAGKFLPGGQAPGAASILSAGVLAKTGLPLMSLGGNIAGGVIKSAKSGLLRKVIGGFSVADELAGIGTATGSGLLGMLGKTGMYLGSGASTAGGLAAAGGSAIVGGLVGAGTLVSAGKNIYHAVTTEDNDERAANIGAASLKGVGVGGGAALGAAIGSVVPGIGTAVGALAGAGIGGLVGMFGGGKVMENYEARKQAAEEAAAAEQLAAEKSKYALSGSRFENEKLKEAFEDTTVAASNFGVMMQEAASQKIQDSFGDISLSMQEIQDAAKQIVFGGDDAGLTKYATAAADATGSFQNMQAAMSAMDKLNWKAGMGMVNDEQSVAQYQAGINNMIASAQQYIEDQHYQATAAIEMLIEPGTQIDMTTGLNTFYADMQSQINDIGGQLTAKMDIALEDGVITLDEQAELANLQSQLAEITGSLADAHSEAKLEAIKIKYSGANLDASSFAGLTSEMQSYVQESGDQYLEGLTYSIKDLKVQLERGAINQQQYDEQIQAFTEGYQAKIQGIAVNVESFQLSAIEDAFGSELDGILPNLEGSAAEKLGQAMHNAMEHGVDVENWDVGEASKWIEGLDGLSAETQSALTTMLSQIAATMPENLMSTLAESGGLNEALGNTINDMAENVDPSEMYSKIFDGGKEIDPTIMSESLANVAESAVESADFSKTGSTLMEKIGEGMSSADFSESGSGLSEGLQVSFLSAIETIDLSGVAEALNAKLGEALASMEFSDSGGLAEGLQNSLMASLESIDLSDSVNGLFESFSGSMEGLDYSGVTSAIGSGISSAIEATMGTIQGAIDSLYSQVGAAIDSAFAAGFTTTTTVTITVNYQLANPTATISFSGGGTGTATVAASIHAEGGFVNGPELSWVGEDGPEAIIPLGAKRRQRGVDLWQRAGHLLGIEGYANGGIIGAAESGGFMEPEEAFAKDGERSFGESVPSKVSGRDGGINVQVNLSPSFEVGGQEEGSIVQKIKEHLAEIAEELGAEIAVKLAEAYENTPA